MKRFHVSVRSLVEHTLRSGDLYFDNTESLQALDGLRAQRNIQEARPGGYQREVTVSRIVRVDQAELDIQGRIDGLLHTDDEVWIEEIKATRKDPEILLSAQDPVHWGQVQVYGYLYALEHSLESLDIQLTYYHWDSEEILSFRKSCRFPDLEELFQRVAGDYLKWMLELDEWLVDRNRTIVQSSFPFEGYRPGQRKLAVEIFRAISGKKHLLVEAPTGIGKTVAALLPAFKAMPSNQVDKVFYLTARTTGKAMPEDSISRLSQTGLRVKSVTLTAKDRICFNPGKECRPEDCEFSRGFYDRLAGALHELFRHDLFDRPRIEEIARRHAICPFQYSMELTRWADCIVSDYNYVFDPRVRLRFLLQEEGGAYCFLVDEAHNLVDRSREIFSAELQKSRILEVRRAVRDSSPTLHRSLGRLNRWFLGQLKLCRESGGHRFLPVPPSSFSRPARSFLTEASDWLSQSGHRAAPAGRAVFELFFEVHRFLRVLENFDRRYIACHIAEGDDLRLRLLCVDPAPQLSEILRKADSAIFLSGTLTPFEYFQKTLGCRKDCGSLLLGSPFPQQNLRVLIHDRIATVYRQRPDTRESVAQSLHQFVSGRTGNYLLFFPSHGYLAMVHDTFRALAPEVPVLVQSREMSEPERLEFLRTFTAEGDRTLVGFAVLGGVFGEGIDLVGERLCGAAIVGVGLPGITPEREQIRLYYDQEWGSGFDYAYRFPGIQRVLQAAGRVIRSEQDRGVVLLIDERYQYWKYRRLLTASWNPIWIRGETDLEMALSVFWNASSPVRGGG